MREFNTRNVAAMFRVRAARIDNQVKSGLSLADKVTNFVGSGAFILAFLGVAATWIVLNNTILHVDVFPYILLNLAMSTMAILMTALILISQKRQESKDRERAIHGYELSLHANAEIAELKAQVAELCAKLDPVIAAIEDPITTV